MYNASQQLRGRLVRLPSKEAQYPTLSVENGRGRMARSLTRFTFASKTIDPILIGYGSTQVVVQQVNRFGPVSRGRASARREQH